MTTDPTLHLEALRVVLDAARDVLKPCSSGGYFGVKPCERPAIYTFGSPNVMFCKEHGRPHEGRHDLWLMERQAKLVAAIAAYEAIEEALPDIPRDEVDLEAAPSEEA
jgi:hypothetical protein